MKSLTFERQHSRFLFVAILIAGVVPSATCAQAQSASGTLEDGDRSAARRVTPVVKVFQQAGPSVVNLSTTSVVTVQPSFGFGGLFDEIFDMPAMRPRQYEAHSVGSGFVIHADGYIVTNAHVVDRASECKVTFADGTELPAEKVAVQQEDDLAVLKVDSPKPLPALPLGRSDDLMPGETVVAIGNPLGYQNTVTTGIISALDRELRFENRFVYSGLIQTDASINPGNSGGPLLNILGECIGINSAIRGDAQNIGFAIPVERLYQLLPQMLDIERIRQVSFGAHFAGGKPDGKGVRIARVDAGSPAAEAGLREGDLLRAIDGRRVSNYMDAFVLLSAAPLGRELQFEIARDGSSGRKCRLALAEIPILDGERLMWERFGLRVRVMTSAETRGARMRRPGLIVTEVDRRSQAFREGILPGDIVTKFGGWPVSKLESLGHLLNQVSAGDRIAVGVWRITNRNIIQVELVLQAT